MTPAAPTWAEVQAFLAADGWRRVPAKSRGGKTEKHIFYEKLVPGDRLLQTHVSKSAGKSMGPGRFGSILRTQLEVSKEEFWECIRTGRPVDRPVPLDQPEPEHDTWVLNVLAGKLHMTAEQIALLSTDEARRIADDYHSTPASSR